MLSSKLLVKSKRKIVSNSHESMLEASTVILEAMVEGHKRRGKRLENFVARLEKKAKSEKALGSGNDDARIAMLKAQVKSYNAESDKLLNTKKKLEKILPDKADKKR